MRASPCGPAQIPSSSCRFLDSKKSQFGIQSLFMAPIRSWYLTSPRLGLRLFKPDVLLRHASWAVACAVTGGRPGYGWMPRRNGLRIFGLAATGQKGDRRAVSWSLVSRFRRDMGQISTARLVIHITVPSILETLSRDAKASVPGWNDSSIIHYFKNLLWTCNTLQAHPETCLKYLG